MWITPLLARMSAWITFAVPLVDLIFILFLFLVMVIFSSPAVSKIVVPILIAPDLSAFGTTCLRSIFLSFFVFSWFKRLTRSLAKASLLGAKTVNGPVPLRSLTKFAALRVRARTDKFWFDTTVSTILERLLGTATFGQFGPHIPQFPRMCDPVESTFVEHQNPSESKAHLLYLVPLYTKGNMQSLLLLGPAIVLHLFGAGPVPVPLNWQWAPVNPDRHVQVGFRFLMEHVPPFRHVKQLQLLQTPVEESPQSLQVFRHLRRTNVLELHCLLISGRLQILEISRQALLCPETRLLLPGTSSKATATTIIIAMNLIIFLCLNV